MEELNAVRMKSLESVWDQHLHNPHAFNTFWKLVDWFPSVSWITQNVSYRAHLPSDFELSHKST